MNNNLSVTIGGVEWKNPITTASGTVNSGKEYSPYVDFTQLGALTSKGVSSEPWLGNPTPRIAESYGGMLNAIGLQNAGVAAFIENDIPYFKKLDTAIIVNICGRDAEDFANVARKLTEAGGVDMLEINVSCPNVKEGGVAFAQDPKATEAIVSAVRKATPLPLITKLSPNVTSIAEIAKAAEFAGSDALSLINTLLAIRINIHTRKPILANTLGGLSGPAIRPVALRCVWQAYKAVKIPLIGMGGILTGEDAVEFMLAGATAVAVGTAHFLNPRATMEVLEGMVNYMEKYGVKDINELIGAAH
ncbi:MAG: dihydroorotate dehydrogenase [Clostridiales bacterium]|jgi:dihydroorotate dehydrogenase (NAD+) catalytic subunit|nr:dihydroorotate dehydrogenase [Clostridiales bacterium]